MPSPITHHYRVLAHHQMVVAAAERNSKRSSNHHQTSTEMSASGSHFSRKKQKVFPPRSSTCSSSTSSSHSSSASSQMSVRDVSSPSSSTFKKYEHHKNTSERRRKKKRHDEGIYRRKRQDTPSTEACTDSTTMSHGMDELSCLKASANAVLNRPPSTHSSSSSDLSDSDRAEMVVEAEKRIAEEVTKFAATSTHLSTHISELLLRVGSLDLSKTAAELGTITMVGEPGDEEPSPATAVDPVPVEARLSRREVYALYQEAEDIWVAGSISNEPNGRLVRFLNLLRVNIRDAVALKAPNPTIVSLFICTSLSFIVVYD